MSWWQSIVIGSAAMAISTLALVVKNPESKKKYYSICVAIWQAAKQLQISFPGDPNFQ